jgi:AcrR family transcriptional regulator
VSVRPTRPALRERYDRRRAEVVLAAARVFAERGYDQTSVPELAEALGLAAGSLYHYFPSKEQLLRAICDQLMDPLLVQAEALLAEPREPAEQLRALVRLWVEHVVGHRDHMLVFQQERHVIERGAAWRGVRASRKAFERIAEDALDRAGAGAAGPAAGARRPARHGQPHGAVVPPARAADRDRDRRRLRGPAARRLTGQDR